LIALFRIVPNLDGSSPPSPVFDFPPRRFIAMAIVSCASGLIEPKDMAPVLNRFTISTPARPLRAEPDPAAEQISSGRAAYAVFVVDHRCTKA
jgi:hypothetical protein